MKVIIVGNGFIAQHLPYEKATTIGEFGSIIPVRLTPNEESIGQFLDECKPDVVINCIGKCGVPNIDYCELAKSETYIANMVIPLMLAKECETRSIYVIHIGSGCLFFGPSPNKVFPEFTETSATTYEIDTGWKETDFANPKSYYSKTKYACDLALGQMKNVAILRIRMPVSPKDTPRNFINKIIGYSKIIDIPNSMTFVDDLVRAIDWFVKNQKIGIYHVVNPQPLSAADVMREYQKYNPSHKFEIITEEELDQITVAKRSNCILDGNKLKQEGFEMIPTQEALGKCMFKYCKGIETK